MTTRIAYMPAILLFGPSHGCCVKVVASQRTPELYTVDQEPLDLSPADHLTPIQLAERTRINRHVYRYHDVMSSPNAEDVAIYVHDENCCEKTLEDQPPKARFY